MSGEANPGTKSMDEIMSLCKRRGFICQASEIYGGINGFWDFGPLGTELKNNLRDAWWHDMVRCPPDGPDGQPLAMVGLDMLVGQSQGQLEKSESKLEGGAQMIHGGRNSPGLHSPPRRTSGSYQ